ncbi:MAG: hypothetical protein C5B50_27180 [Verrucomicrobia bacterium]|nr:MAG: hypothetical protein C5B50_27180 [Verrucomicrobiota bacterium]
MRVQQFARCGKPLKRLAYTLPLPHRAKAAVLMISAAIGLAVSSPAAERHAFHYKMPPVEKAKPAAQGIGWKQLNLAIGLPLRNEAELERFLHEVTDPASPNYRHYLTPQQFTARFGPTEADYAAIIRFAQKNHLAISGTHPNRMVLDVKGMVTDIERAFSVKLRVYQHPVESRTFFAPENAPTIELGVPLLTVSGLDNFVVPRPMSLHKLDQSQDQKGWSKPKPQTGTGSGPGGSLMGYDFRAAYLPGVTLTGTGQTVGLLEFDSGFYLSDIQRYETMSGLPNVPVQAVLIDNYNGGAGGANDEVSLDIEMAIAMAPGLSAVLVYEGSSTDDILNRIATDNQAKQIGASWTYPTDATSEQIWKEMIAQGQSFYNASGDSDAYTGTVPTPSDGTNIICVGGTTLTTSGPVGNWVSETVWNWGGGTGSSGGISTINTIPVWQQGIDMTAAQGSTTKRNLPDVSMPADNIYVTYNNGQAGAFGGTSCATPLWAGWTALANQLALANSQPLVGFINPAVYAFGKGSNVLSYTSLFHDITTGNNESPSSPSKFAAVPGYDLCTGWGSPYGSNLLMTLAVPEPLHVAPGSGLIISGPAGGPFTPPASAFALTTTGGGSFNWGIANTSVWFSVSPSSGTLTHGGPPATVVVTPTAIATNLGPGSYPATVLVTNLSDQFVQSRQITLAIVTPPVITSQPANQPVLWGAPASFTVGTAPNALLYYQWQLNGTNLTDVGSISGSLASTLMIAAAAPTNAGSYSVIVSNVTGVVVSSNALLSIVPSPPVVSIQPTNNLVLPGAPASFSVAAIGNQPFTYRWQFNGTNLVNGANISGATTNILSLASTLTTNAGTYSVLISNTLGWTSSTGAVLSLISVTVPGITFSPFYSFPSDDKQGDSPYGPLAKGKDGRLYGTTLEGGTNYYGTVFRVSTNGTFNTLYSLNYTLGGYVYAGLVQGSDLLLYGASYLGGASGLGTLFRLTTGGTGFIDLASLNGNSGEYPVAGMIQGTDGNFYGTILEGGVYGYGTVFKTTSTGTRTTLISFNWSDGAYPSSVLVQGADGNFYGTTENGGTYGNGTVFRISSTGSFTTLYSFTGLSDGAIPIPGLALGIDGNFYGNTLQGGTNGLGTLFKITPAGAFTSLHSFNGATDGANPWGGIVQSSDGNLYGTTMGGGPYGDGTVFRLTLDGELTTMMVFDGYQGSAPAATLTQGGDGNLYGTTSSGGTGGYGTVFQLGTAGPLQITSDPQDQTIYLGGTARFTVGTFGSLPVTYQWQVNGTNLVDGGNVWGSTTSTLLITNAGLANVAFYSVIVSNAYGPVQSDEAFLELLVSPPQITGQPSGQLLLQGETASFTVQAVGDLPLTYQWRDNGTNLSDGGQISGSLSPTLTIANLTAANAGSYSVVVYNGAGHLASSNALLTVLPVSPPFAALTLPHLFSDGSDGAFPYANLMQAKDGSLYGTASSGGSSFNGEVFRMSLTGTLTALYGFKGGNDGIAPYSGLVQTPNSTFFGTTGSGGTNGYGTIFRMNTSGTAVELYAFANSNDGATPYGTLIVGTDGKLYGTAIQGGANGLGTVFRSTTNGVVTPLYTFTGGNDGSYPYAGVIQAADGSLYGTTVQGGAYNYGAIFQVSTQGVWLRSVPLDYTNGASPYTALVQAPDGNLYGTAAYGGLYGYGTVFRVSADGTLTTIVSFNSTNGATPFAGVIFGTDGNLYGTTSTGGSGGYGTVFKVTTNGVLTTLASFDGYNGAYASAPLVQATNGNFYGTTAYGGIGFNGTAYSGQGTIFELTVPAFDTNPLMMPVITAGLAYSGNLSGKAVSVPGDTLTFAKLSGPAWLAVASDGTLSGTPLNANIGTNSFAVSLTDTNGISTTATMLVPVVSPVAPSFATNPFTAAMLNEGQPVSASIASQAVNPNPGDANNFALLSGPAWLLIQTNGTLSGTPGLADIGTNSFLVSVSDLLALSNTATMYVVVFGPPVFTSNPFSGPYGVVSNAISASILGSANDPNAGHGMVYGLVSGPSWLSISANGSLRGTPLAANAGTNAFVVSATDSSGLSAQATMNLYVYTPPTFALKPFFGPKAISGLPYYDNIATNAAPNPDAVVGDTLSFRKANGPAWLSVALDGTLSGAPSDTDVGTNHFNVTIRDSVSVGSGSGFTIVVSTDSPPVFLSTPFTLPAATPNVPYSGTISTNATDPDLPYGDTLTFVKVNGPAWLTVSNNGSLGGTPGCTDAGTNAFLVSVRDYDGLSNNATLLITVQGPASFVANPVSTPWANVDQAYSASIAGLAIEPKTGATPLFGKTSGPGWLNVQTNGTISGTPQLANAGTNTFVVSVTDFCNVTNTATLYVYVNSPPSFNPSQFTAPQAVAGTPYSGSISNNATDPDFPAGDTLSFYKVTGPSWLSVAAGGGLSGTPSTPDLGTNTFMVLVVDSGNLTALGVMKIKVAAAPIQLAITRQTNQISLTWTGGTPPYQLQTASNIASATWVNLGPPTNGTLLRLTPTNAAAWFRVKGQ